MEEKPDYIITHTDDDGSGHILRLDVRRWDNPANFQPYNRNDVLKKMRKGKTFWTATRDGADWKLGAKVREYEGYLRTDANETKKDNLEELKHHQG